MSLLYYIILPTYLKIIITIIQLVNYIMGYFNSCINILQQVFHLIKSISIGF